MTNPEHTNDLLKRRLLELVEYSRNMLKQAEDGEWEEVANAQQSRQDMLEAFYASTGIKQLPGITEATQELLQINQSLERLALSARQTAVSGAVTISKGRRAVKAYAQNAR